MEDADKDQKTEEATAKRLQEARDRGELAISREMSSLFMVVSIFIVVSGLISHLAVDLKESLRVFLEKPDQISLEGGGLQDALFGVVGRAGFAGTLVFGVFLVMAALGTMIQTDFYVGGGRLKLDFNKLSPAAGLKRLFSANSLTELVKSFLKMVVVGYLTYRVLEPVFDLLPQMVGMTLLQMLLFLQDKCSYLLLVLLVLIALIAVADLLYQRYQYFKNLRMTKQEVKDENKQMEGDPLVKGRLRQIRIERARRRMMAKVPKASVVITNPTHYAIALEYDGKKMLAPVLIAKGIDQVALRIRDVAESHEIPLVSNPPLARALYDTVDLDQPITPEHYRAVAEVISYVYKLKKNKR